MPPFFINIFNYKYVNNFNYEHFPNIFVNID